MAIDQMTLAEETAPPQDIQKLLEGLETGKFYAPDESPWAGDFSDFFKLAQKIKARKKFEEYPELHREEYLAGAPYATTPRHWTQNLIPDLQDMRSLWTFGTGGGDMAMELAGLTPGSKAGIMGLAAIKNNPKYAEIIYEMPKSVWRKMKTPLKSRILRDEGKAAFSYSDPAFAQKNYLEPVIGKTQSAKYKYTITHEGKHYFKHKNNESIKSVNSADPRIKENLRLPYKDDKSVLARRQDDVKKADLMKVRKQRLQTEAAADDLFQLRDTTLPPEVRAATLERYKEYPEAVKQEAIKKLDDIGGPAGGSGAGLPSLKGKYPNWFSPKEATRMDNLLTPIKGDIPIVNEFKEGYKLMLTNPNNIPKNRQLKNVLTKKKLSALNPNEASVLKQNIMNVTEEEIIQMGVSSKLSKKLSPAIHRHEVESYARGSFPEELDILDTILGGGGY